MGYKGLMVRGSAYFGFTKSANISRSLKHLAPWIHDPYQFLRAFKRKLFLGAVLHALKTHKEMELGAMSGWSSSGEQSFFHSRPIFSDVVHRIGK